MANRQICCQKIRIGDPILNTNDETELLVLSESRGGDPAFNNELASTDLSSEWRPDAEL